MRYINVRLLKLNGVISCGCGSGVRSQGHSQKFVSDGTKQGDWGQKSSSGVQGQSPGRDLGAKAAEAEDMLTTIAMMC